MQTVPKTQRLLAEEVAQTFIDGHYREIRNCIKNQGRTLTRRLIVAIYLAAPKSSKYETLILESVNAFTHLESVKLKGLVKVLDQ